MTDHNNKISIHQTLLNNSLISGVEIKELSINLSEIGHGLYIESNGGDRYADLRSCSSKAFWGHTHPLEIQNQFGQLPKVEVSARWQTMSSNSATSRLKGSQITSFSLEKLRLNTTPSKVNLVVKVELQEIYESLDQWDQMVSQLALISKVRPLVIWEKDLIPLTDSGLSAFDSIDCEKFIEISHPETLLTNIDNHVSTTPPSPLVNALLKFFETIVYSEYGKLIFDRAVIDSFIASNALTENISRRGHILVVNSLGLSPHSFLTKGILVSPSQFLLDQVFLSLPCACTKEELLDTLERVKNVI